MASGSESRPMARHPGPFIVGLGVLLALIYLSFLGNRQLTLYEFGFLVSATLAALLFDYFKLGWFLATVSTLESSSGSHEEALDRALASTLRSRRLHKLISTELATLYYAFLARHRAPVPDDRDDRFSYAKSSNARDVFLFVALSQLPFVPFLHVFIETHKGPGPAWLITLLTLWSVVWYLAQVEATRFRPIEIRENTLRYRFGLMWTANIPLEHIRSARSIEVSEELTDRDLFLSPLGSSKNVMLEFDAPIEFRGPWFIRRRERRAAISVDNPSRFLTVLAARSIGAR